MKVIAKIALLDERGRHPRGSEFITTRERGEKWIAQGKALEVPEAPPPPPPDDKTASD